MASQNYHPVTKSFHWLVAALVAVQFAVGWLMPDVRGNSTPQGLVGFHFSFGILILLVMLLRVLWLATHPNPPLLKGNPRWQDVSAKLMHYLLYLLLIVLPITGWLLASAHGWSVSLFGIITLPSLVSATRSNVQLYDFAHVATVTVVAFLIVGHTMAALYHYFVTKDRVLQRMLPQSWSI